MRSDSSASARGFALVPLYDVLCEVTGFGNQKLLLQASSQSNAVGAEARARDAAAAAVVDERGVGNEVQILVG